MNVETLNRETDALARRYDYGDRQVLAADLGIEDESVSVDVVDDTVILVVAGETDEQYELNAPEGDLTRAFINNGVVTVEVER
jgi:HSP20 family molecular chaperone IbpA